MQTKNFRSVVIKHGRIIGYLTGKMMTDRNLPTTIIDLKQETLSSETNFDFSSFDASKLHAVAGWGEITHIYYAQDETPCVDETPSKVNRSQANLNLTKSKLFSWSFSDAAELA